MSKRILTWLDVETFGLDAYDPIIEIGVLVTDLELEPIAENSFLVWTDRHRRRFDEMNANQFQNESEAFVLKMHTDNGLFEEARKNGMSLSGADIQLYSWLKSQGFDNQPIVGNSVHQDRVWLRAQMPMTFKAFHYRIIDNSTIKELCKRYAPAVYEACPGKKEEHRVLPDLEDSIEEFRYYRDNFLKVELDV
jgi:oligoribonuclease